MRISDSIREAVDRFKRKVATAHKSGGSFVGLALRKNNRAASSLLTRLETRDSRHETRNCRVSCLASRVSSDCQVTFGRYCTSAITTVHSSHHPKSPWQLLLIRYYCIIHPYWPLKSFGQEGKGVPRSTTMANKLMVTLFIGYMYFQRCQAYNSVP